jgi:hypothetical protein
MLYRFLEKVYDWLYGETFKPQPKEDYGKVLVELQEKFATKDLEVTAESPTNGLEFTLSISALGFDSQDEVEIDLGRRCCQNYDHLETISWGYESSCSWLQEYTYFLRELDLEDEYQEDIPPHIVKTIEAWDRTKERRDNEYEKKKRKKQNLTARRFAKQLYKKSISDK